ncbi:MAG: hypothetical protein R3F23_00560 [Verrucomicrobiia bacterium]
MKVETCRAAFTAEDFDFVVKTLSRSPKDAVSLVDLLSDEEMRDEILDHERLYQELIENGSCLKVSPAFYFYVLTRHVLKKAGLTDRTICDYVALILVNFSRWQRLPHFFESSQGESFYPYLSDLLQAIAKAESHQVFILRIYLANYALFYSGIFVERIVANRNRRGGPDVSFYEEVGRTNYQLAAEHRSAQKHHLQGVLDELAQAFRPTRFALNDLSENLLHLSPNPSWG